MKIRDYKMETEKRVEFIRGVLRSAGAGGFVFGNSGGKDCALAGILCKMACGNTLGLIMPCGSKRNYGSDMDDAKTIAGRYGIETRVIDLSKARDELIAAAGAETELSKSAVSNMAPRLRMAALYAVAASENRLVVGTGNRSEIYMGYFTKWGDGAYDLNPIADLTVSEVYEFLKYLDAPAFLFEKAPSAGLFEGQTDENEMGVTYKSIDEFLLSGNVNAHDRGVIDRFHNTSEHKRKKPVAYGVDYG